MTGLKIIRLKFEPFDIYDIGYERIFSKIKIMSVMSSMMETPKKYIGVVKIQWFDEPEPDILKDLKFIDKISQINMEDEIYLYILTGRHLPFFSKLYAEMIETYDCFFDYPTVFTKDSIYMSIVGSQENLNTFVNSFPQLGMEFEIVSKKNYFVKGKGMLSSLTVKQYEYLKFACENGYYDIPKKTQVRDLAKKKGLSHSTFSMHLRKAEKALFTTLFH